MRASNEQNKDANLPDTARTSSVAKRKGTEIAKKIDPALTSTSERVANWIDGFSRIVSGNKGREETQVDVAARAPIVFGVIVLILFFVFGMGWAMLAPLDSAAVAQGIVVLDANKKTVQHLEGGIIAEILVKDGDEVKEGQPLVRLNETTAEARQALVESQIITNSAIEARLLSERDGLEEIRFPQWLMDQSSKPEIYEVLDAEKRFFETRKASLQGRGKQLNGQIEGLKSQQAAAAERSRLLSQEVNVVQKLVDSGQATMPRLLSLKRSLAEIQGNEGQYKAEIAKTELEIINVKNEVLKEVVAKLQEVQTQLADLKERKRAAVDISDRIVITAPRSGIVNNMKYFTVGGVIAPGSPIMDIIPQDDDLVIEALVLPQDIDVVHAGLKARVRLTAYKTRSVPMLDGHVIHVSADRHYDDKSGASFFKAKVVLEEGILQKLTEPVKLYPGMPADVLIVTGERTFMHYLMSPITDTFRKAFREQ